MPETYDIIIIGGGPAGLAAALYASRARHKTLVLEKAVPGGQLAYAARVDDYPGLPDGLSGPDLGQRMWDQAMKFGAEAVMAEATGIELEGGHKLVHTTEGDYRGRGLILATGSDPKRLGVAGELELDGRGVSCCALCSAIFFENQPVVVAGGSDAALTEAIYLAQSASKVTVVTREHQLTAMEVLQEEARANPSIEFLPETEVEEILGQEAVTGVRLRALRTGARWTIDVAGVFVHIGRQPNTGLCQGLLRLEPSGHVPVDEWMETEVPGLFAAGDVRVDAAGWSITAAGDGATAAIRADHYLQGAE